MKTAIDKNGDTLKIGDQIIVPDPKETDYWLHSFSASIIKINDDYIIVEDGDGDCWDVEGSRLELDTDFN